MKILLIGDFGGSFPNELHEKVLREEFDFILCNGDFADIKELRDLLFKYGPSYKEKFSQEYLDNVRLKGIEKSRPVLDKLNSLGKKVFFVGGNNERIKYNDFLDLVSNYENLICISSEILEEEKFSVFGYQVDAPSVEASKDGRIDEEDLEKLNNLPKGNWILLSHYPPYNCSLDKLPEDNKVRPGQHIGSSVVRSIVEKFSPRVVICGHLEEHQGEDHIGSTKVVNPGSAEEGKYAILDTGKNLENFHVEFKSA